MSTAHRTTRLPLSVSPQQLLALASASGAGHRVGGCCRSAGQLRNLDLGLFVLTEAVLISREDAICGCKQWVWVFLGIALVVSGASAQATASPTPQQPTLSSVTSLQCPSRTLCVGIGFAGPNLVTSRSPRSGTHGWAAETIDGGRLLKLLSCVSAHWCLAVDHQDRIWTSTDPARGAASWKLAPGGRAGVLDNVSALSCPTPRLCVGVAGHYVISSVRPGHGGSAWRQALVNQDASAEAIDCPTATRCAAGYDGQVLTTTDPTAHTPWMRTRLERRSRGVGPVSVSCASRTRCVVSYGDKDAFNTTSLAVGTATWHRSRLGPSLRAGHPARLLELSCTTADVCAAIRDDGSIWASPSPGLSGERYWKRVAVDGPVATVIDPLLSIACVRGQLCVATDRYGRALTANAITKLRAWRRQTIGSPYTAASTQPRDPEKPSARAASASGGCHRRSRSGLRWAPSAR